MAEKATKRLQDYLMAKPDDKFNAKKRDDPERTVLNDAQVVAKLGRILHKIKLEDGCKFTVDVQVAIQRDIGVGRKVVLERRVPDIVLRHEDDPSVILVIEPKYM